ncbi:MAG: MarC family protein [Phaeodactylibacter sp.]|nr:MarC family protein [Phaeodactylibacter sp.]MCB0613834.1 MarC family protein [Phaeodactylibacter sp.]
MNFKELISVTLVLFSVIDILGSIPILIGLKKKGIKIEAAKASVASLLIMTLFLYGGEALLHLFGIDVESFAVAGAIILFLMGMEMVLGVHIFHDQPDTKSGTIVPVAFPLIAGAGTMTTIIALKADFQSINIQLGIVLNIIFVFLVLRSSNWISDKLGEGGANVLRKVFGIILLAIAIKLFRDNFHLIITPTQVLSVPN